jgi:hypothetical protein
MPHTRLVVSCVALWPPQEVKSKELAARTKTIRNRAAELMAASPEMTDKEAKTAAEEELNAGTLAVR